MNNLIRSYIKNLTEDDVRSWSARKGILLTDEESEYAFKYIKNNYDNVLNNPESFNIEEHEKKFSKENYQKLKELVIFEEGISTVDINEQRKNLPITIKEIKIYDSKAHGIAGNLVKYNQLVAEKYDLDKEYAYDYNLKPNIRQRKRNF